jgi:hypothetical protein
MQGKSFLPLVTGSAASKPKWRDAIYYHYYENGEHSVSPHFGIKTKRYKLIRFYTRVNTWELYDLEKDPNEMKNIFGKKGTEIITITLKKQLSDLIDQYDDDEAKKLMGIDASKN